MAYYEQIGEACRERERRRAAMHPLRRRLGDMFVALLIWLGSELLRLLILAALVSWALP